VSAVVRAGRRADRRARRKRCSPISHRERRRPECLGASVPRRAACLVASPPLHPERSPCPSSWRCGGWSAPGSQWAPVARRATAIAARSRAASRRPVSRFTQTAPRTRGLAVCVFNSNTQSKVEW